MKCPCCEAAEVSSGTDTCDLCGYSTQANAVATAEGGAPDGKGANPSKTAVKLSDSVESGHAKAITIRLKDGKGKPLKAGGDKIVVAVTGANRAQPRVTDVKNGSYTASYTPTVAGTDRLAITLNGVPVAGSPFTVDVTPGPPDVNRTTAKVPEGTAGRPTKIPIDVFDANNNPVLDDDTTIDVTVQGANDGAGVTISEKSGSSFEAIYTPTKTGIDEITVSLSGVEVAASPFTSTIKPGASDPAQCQVKVPTRGVPGQGATITVKTRDSNRNYRRVGGDSITIQIARPTKTKLEVRDVGDGTYTAIYTPAAPGTDEIVVQVNGESLPDSPFKTEIESGTPDAGQTTTTIPPGIAGDPSTITVTIRDKRGNTLTGAPADLAISVTGANTADPEFRESLDGVYSAIYVPMSIGTDRVVVTVDGIEVPGSPFESDVEAGDVDAADCELTVPTDARVGDPIQLELKTVDSSGNRIAHGGETVEVVVTGSNDGIDVEVNDLEDGTYKMTYVPEKNGEDQIVVAVNNVDVSDDASVIIIETGSASASETEVKLGNGRSGVETHLTVTTRDAFGNQLSDGGESVTMRVEGANAGTRIVVRDNHDGTYAGTYTPTKADIDYVAVLLNGEMISDSPCTSSVEPGPGDPAGTTATHPSSSRAGALTNVSIFVQDAHGNAAKGAIEDITVTVQGPNAKVEVKVEGKDGAYLAKFTPTISGSDDIIIELGGQQITDSPLVHTVESGEVDALKSDATGPTEGRVAELYTVTVFARDKFTNQCGAGSHVVEVAVTGANDGPRVEVVDNEDGTYSATYTPQNPGADRVAVKLNGVHIGGDPVRPQIQVGGASASSTLEVPDGRAGKPTKVLITARDQSANALPTGGDRVVVSVSVANSATPTVEDHGDGTYTATYTPTHVGSDYISATMGGTPINGGPFVSKVTAGPLDAERTRVVVPPTGMAGAATDIAIHACDLHGNEIQHGGQQFVVQIDGVNDSTTAEFTDNDDGTYTVSYTPTRVGDDTVTITLPGGENVGGGEFKCTVAPGDPDSKQTTVNFPDGIVGMLTRVSVTVRDKYRNRVPAGDRVKLTLEGANELTALQVTDHRDGTFTATYTPTTSGDDRLVVTIDDKVIDDGPFGAVVHAGPGSSGRAVVEVGHGVCGQATVVTITARDEFGNIAKRGGDVVTVSIDGVNAGTGVKCVDNGDGTYEATYMPTVRGTDFVVVRMNAGDVENSPFKSNVAAGDVDVGRTEVVVPAGTAEARTGISILTRDAFNNRITKGGASVVARVEGANIGATVDVTDNDDGTYTLTYVPRDSGIDTIDIIVNERPTDGNPFMSVVAAPAVDEQEETHVESDTHLVEDEPTKTIEAIATDVTQTMDALPVVERPDPVSSDEDVTAETIVIEAVAESAEPPEAAVPMDSAVDIAVNETLAEDEEKTQVIEAIDAEIDEETTQVVEAIAPETAREDPESEAVPDLEDQATHATAPIEAAATVETEPVRPAPAIEPEPIRRSQPVDRSTLHPFVTCPRCASTVIAPDLERCDWCGWDVAQLIPDHVTIADESRDALPETPSELDELVARELGDQFDISTVLASGDDWLIAVANFPDGNEPSLVRVCAKPAAAGALEAFRRDASRVKRVKHPRVIPLERAGATDSLAWYSTRLVRGRTLRAYLQTADRLPVDAGVMVFQQITDALDHLHKAGVYHGGLTTNAIVIDENNQAWLTLPPLAGFEATDESERFEYMPPESFEGSEKDAAADQYSLAVCAYESLSGARPFSGGKTKRDFAALHEQRVAPRLSELRREIPLHVSTAIERAMERRADRRFDSIVTFGSSLSAPTDIEPLRVPKQRASRRADTRVFVIDKPLRPFPSRRIGMAATITLALFGALEWINRPVESVWATVDTAPIEDPVAATIDSLRAIQQDSLALLAIEPEPPPRRPTRPPVDNTPARLWVNSQPTGQLWIDGLLMGFTPQANISIAPGPHTIRVVRLGFASYEQNINLAPGDSVRLTTIQLLPR